MRLALFHANPRADSATPAKTATARFVATVATVTSAMVAASVLGILRTRAKLVQSKMSNTRTSMTPVRAAIGTRSMNPAPKVTYARIAAARDSPATLVRPPPAR